MWLVKVLCTKLGNQERLVFPDQDSISSLNKCSVPTLHFFLPLPKQDCQEEKKKKKKTNPTHFKKNKQILCRDLKCWNITIAILEFNDIRTDMRLHLTYSQVLYIAPGRIEPKERLLWAVKAVLQLHVFHIIFPYRLLTLQCGHMVSWETASNAWWNKILKF